MADVFAKETISLRYWLLGREYYRALRAMEFGARYHRGLRKDGLTPEFQHQIEIAQYVRTLEKGLLYPEPTLATVFLHDAPEDYNVSLEEIGRRFGSRVRRSVWRLTKQYHGESKAAADYFREIARCPISSVVKGADRIHNFGSMVGVFSLKKQREYIEEGEKYILPMLKRARRNFPEQEGAYENIKAMLGSQARLIREMHAAAASLP